MERRDFFRILQGVGSLAVVSAGQKWFTDSRNNPNNYTIAVNIPFSSFFNEESNQLILGHFLAAHHINSNTGFSNSPIYPHLNQAGLLGKKVQIHLKDTAGNSKVARSNAKEFFQQVNTVMISGGSSSEEVLANREIAKQYEKVCMDGISHSNRCSTNPKGFSLNFDNNYTAQAISKHLPSASNFFQVYVGYDWSHMQMDSFRTALEDRGASENGRVHFDNSDVKSIVREVIASGSDTLILNLYSQKLLKFVTSLTEQPELVQEILKNRITVVAPLLSDSLERNFNFNKIPNLLAMKIWDAKVTKDPVSQNFAQLFQDYYGLKPYESAYVSYFQTMNFCNAAQAVQSFEYSKVKDFLTKKAHPRFRYSSNDHRSFEQGVVLRSRHGGSYELDRQLV